MGRRAVMAKPVLNEVVLQIMAIQKARFAANRFKPLAVATKATKKRKGQDPRKLRATGALARSLTIRGAPHQYLKVTNDELVFGTTLFYAKFHALGKSVPKRKPLDITPKNRVPIAHTILDFLKDG